MNRFARSDKLFFLTAFLLGLSLFVNVNLVSSQQREGAGDVESRIEPAASDVDLNSVVTVNTVFAAVPGTIVFAPFSSFPRRCVLRFSAEARATAGDRLDIRTSVNGGACIVAGPEFFSQDVSLQTRTNQSIVNVGAGAPNFRPCWRRAQLVADAAADQVQLFFRTYTVECSTN